MPIDYSKWKNIEVSFEHIKGLMSMNYLRNIATTEITVYLYILTLTLLTDIRR